MRAAVLERDGQRCKYVDEEATRCPATGRLEVHHTTPLHRLWKMANGNRAAFVEVATDPHLLIATCPSHNRALDAAFRQAN